MKALVRPDDPHPPAEDDLARTGGQPGREVGELRIVEDPVGKLERALHPGLIGARPDDLWPRAAPHQEVERVREHGLAGAGLAGDRVEARAEAQLGALDQEQVLDPQLVEHPPVLASGSDGFAPPHAGGQPAVAGSASGRTSSVGPAGAGPPCGTMSRPRTSTQLAIPPTRAIAAPTAGSR